MNEFLIGEYEYFSVNAGLATRNQEFPIYNIDTIRLNHARNVKIDIYKYLRTCFIDYIKTSNETEHVNRIIELKSVISDKYSKYLFNGTLRIGVCQKIINLFCKYLWQSNIREKPIHCPIDNIIKRRIQDITGNYQLINWTELDTIRDYQDYISELKIIAKKRTN
jgi:hypothetical protein